ncbi:DUF6907 domain-containing protein [Streptomyces sp. NPDC088197]|uniref:DUF6907 domain-containing protein n=1 Tax=unclassified Streptomyces TaxID=2593676 RepID=UPI0037F28BCD
MKTVSRGPAAETDVPARPGRTWEIASTDNYTATGYLPTWAEDDPSTSGVSLARLFVLLGDMCHQAHFDGQRMRVAHAREPGEESAVFSGTIDCTPYAEDTAGRLPVANVWIVDDYWVNGLDPTGLATFAAQLRAQADYLDREVYPLLVAARAEWTARHAGPPSRPPKR